MELQERLALFYQRLQAAPPAASADEAMRLVCNLIEQVESEHCSLPREELPPLKYTGRMYAPQADRMRRFPDGGLVANARQHRIYCQKDGSISIVRIPDNKTVLTKTGKKP